MMITRQVRCKKCGEMFPLTYPEKLMLQLLPITCLIFPSLKSLVREATPTSMNRTIRPSMIITKLVTPRLPIIIPPSPRRFGGAFVPLVTVTPAISLLSGRVAPPTITMPIILVGCGPALPPNPPQDDPAPIPPPKGGGSGREPQIKIIMAA